MRSGACSARHSACGFVLTPSGLTLSVGGRGGVGDFGVATTGYGSIHTLMTIPLGDKFALRPEVTATLVGPNGEQSDGTTIVTPFLGFVWRSDSLAR